MDAAAARAYTDAKIDRKMTKFMRRFDRWVKRAARRGEYRVLVEVSYPGEEIGPYADHLTQLGYDVWVSPTKTMFHAYWEK